MTNPLAGYGDRKRARDADALRAALLTAGLPVPVDLDNALKSLGWTIETQAALDDSALFTAKTEAEYSKAATVYADALAKCERLLAVQEVATTARLNVVSAVLPAAKAEVVPAVIERFDTAAGLFTDAVQAFPDVDITSLSTEQFSYFAKAREHADEMRRAYTVYRAVYGADPTQGLAADTTWFRIADLDDTDALRAVYEANQRHRSGGLSPLTPYYAVVRNGGTLRLVRPDDAKSSHEMAMARQHVKDEENRPVDRGQPNEARLTPSSAARLNATLRPMGR